MARKISVDLTDENFEALDKFKESRNMPYSIIINRLLRILCKSPDIKDELITICKSRIRALYAEMDQVGTFECQKLYNKSAQYMEILSFLTQNPQITVSSILDEAQMKKIRLVDGYLMYPENFILLNESAAQTYRNVCIVEVRNAQFPVPHFIYFSGNNPSHYTDADTTYINQLCVRHKLDILASLPQMILTIPICMQLLTTLKLSEIERYPFWLWFALKRRTKQKKLLQI